MKRRQFLACLAGLPFSVLPFLSAASRGDPGPARKPHRNLAGRVVIARRPEVFSSPGVISEKALAGVLQPALCSLTGEKSLRDSWLSLFSPSEKIGIKVNALGGRRICTHPELAYAVAHQLTACGVPAHNIVIWDRLTRELAVGGYAIQRAATAVRCYGTDDEYENSLAISGTIGSCFSTILTRACDALISIPVLKDHDLAGVSLSLKNFYGAIHNPNKYHDNGCDPYIADLNCHPHIKNKLRLVIIDALTVQYHGGPAFKPQWSLPYGGIIVSGDPVAADLAGTHILEAQRTQNGLPSLQAEGRFPAHIHTAAQRGLGIDDTMRIEKIFT